MATVPDRRSSLTSGSEKKSAVGRVCWAGAACRRSPARWPRLGIAIGHHREADQRRRTHPWGMRSAASNLVGAATAAPPVVHSLSSRPLSVLRLRPSDEEMELGFQGARLAKVFCSTKIHTEPSDSDGWWASFQTEFRPMWVNESSPNFPLRLATRRGLLNRTNFVLGHWARF
jgi:hypothetical protein